MKNPAVTITLVLLGCAALLSAAPAIPAMPPSSADRARDAAIQALIDLVLTRPTASRPCLSTELATAADADRALREFIAAGAEITTSGDEPAGEPVRCRASLTIARLNQFLTGLAARDPYMLDIRRLKFSGGGELSAESTLDPSRRPFDDHPGWRHCLPEEVSISRRAAAEDLRANLMLDLRDLRATVGGSLGDVMMGRPEARKAIVQALEKLEVPEPSLEPYGVCRVRLVLARKQVLALLQGALRDNRENTGIDWARLAASMPLNISAEGYAVAPPVRAHRATTRASD